jgi:hypothetical protein
MAVSLIPMSMTIRKSMEAVPSPCLVCETGDDARILFRLPNCTVTRCGRCGFVYLNGERNWASEGRRYDWDQFQLGTSLP